MTDMERARRWLAEAGVRQTGPDAWRHDDEPDRTLTKSDVAMECSAWIFEDTDLDEDARIHVAFGLMDLLDQLWTAIELHMHYCSGKGRPVPPSLWDALRVRLEAVDVAECTTYQLWCEWFECVDTQERAFGALLGDDFATDRTGADDDAFLRRAARVLEYSGPVPWPVKQPTYEHAVAIDVLRPAVFRSILASYHDFFGKLEPEPALALLDRLDLPDDTEHLRPLRTVLAAGHTSHYAAPDAWTAAQPTSADQPQAR